MNKSAAIPVVALLLAATVACSTSGTVQNSPGASGGLPSAPGGPGHGGDGGLIGGSTGGGSVPDAGGLSPQQIAGKTDPAVCQQVTAAISDAEKAIDKGTFGDPTAEVKAYRDLADKLGALQGQEVGPVAMMNSVAVLSLRIAANELSQPGKRPNLISDHLDYTAAACTKQVANTVTGSKLEMCARLERTFTDTDTKLAGEVGDAAAFKADAASAAKATSALESAAHKADSTYNLAANVVDMAQAYQSADPASEDSVYQIGNQAEGIARDCDGGVNLF